MQWTVIIRYSNDKGYRSLTTYPSRHAAAKVVARMPKAFISRNQETQTYTAVVAESSK